MTTYPFENMKVEKITAPYPMGLGNPPSPPPLSPAPPSYSVERPSIPSAGVMARITPRRLRVVVREPEGAGDEPVHHAQGVRRAYDGSAAQGNETGSAFSVSRDTDTLVFSNYNDQPLHKQSTTDSSPAPVTLTPDYGGPVVSYADGVFDSRFNRYVTLREDARQSATEPITTIVAVELSGMDIMEPKVLVSGSDFYAFPRLDSKGKRIAWIEWFHPNMQWRIQNFNIG